MTRIDERLAVLETEMKNIKRMISNQNKMIWVLIGAIGASIGAPVIL